MSTFTTRIYYNYHLQKKSIMCTSYSPFLRCGDDCVVEMAAWYDELQWKGPTLCVVHLQECVVIGLQEQTQGNGHPSMHKFPGNLPSSSSPQICLDSGSFPQHHQTYKDAGQWHCISGLGSPCPRHFISLAPKTDLVRTSRLRVQF